jgi:hypothetical protein
MPAEVALTKVQMKVEKAVAIRLAMPAAAEAAGLVAVTAEEVENEARAAGVALVVSVEEAVVMAVTAVAAAKVVAAGKAEAKAVAGSVAEAGSVVVATAVAAQAAAQAAAARTHPTVVPVRVAPDWVAAWVALDWAAPAATGCLPEEVRGAANLAVAGSATADAAQAEMQAEV